MNGSPMQQLTEIVVEFVRDKQAAGTGWYTWSFEAGAVPSGVAGVSGPDAGGADWYARNVALKHGLHAAWLAQPARRAELERYYVVDWGSVRSNKAQTLAGYHGADAQANIARGSRGIPSWSKALSVRDPFAYAIFDARVSASLNALQVIHHSRIGAPRRFPLLTSRNARVARGMVLLRRHFREHAWPRVRRDFYGDYLALCRAGERIVSNGEPLPLYAVEMTLFAHTEALLDAAFPDAG